MKQLIRVAAVLSIVASGACKKKEAGGTSSAGSASGSAATAKAEAPKPASCSPTAWKEPTGLFCIEAPPGYKPGDLKKEDGDDPKVQIYFTKPGEAGKPDQTFNISWYPKRDAKTEAVTTAANMDNDFKNNTGEDKGDFAGGKGKYVVFSRKDDAKSKTLYSIVQGNKSAYECDSSNYDAPIPPEVITACKSLTPTD